MAFWPLKKFIQKITVGQTFTVFRYVRNVSRRGEKHKLLKGTVKTIENPNDGEYSRIESYKDFVKRAKSALHTTDLEIEKSFTDEADFNPSISTSTIADETLKEDKEYKSFVKKKIIGRKYIKMEIETNLLTHAAKVQIRYLHSLNPEEWTPEVLALHFPITVSGVKKLLKSNFVLKSPEKIKEHDEEVAKRWETLEAGKPSELISFYTQCMWNKGKIIKQNYKGNPNFPTEDPDKNKIIHSDEGKKTGEYSAIVEQYINYKKEKESVLKLSSSEKCQVIESPMDNLNIKIKKNRFNFFNRNRHYIDDEIDDSIYNKRSAVSDKPKFKDEINVLHSQFKENLMEEKHSDELTEWMKNQSKVQRSETTKNSAKTTELFLKISKYNKELNRDLTEEGSNATFNNKLKYAYPKIKNIKRKINSPQNLHKRNTLYKVDQCIYDKNGEFLYKLPT